MSNLQTEGNPLTVLSSNRLCLEAVCFVLQYELFRKGREEHEKIAIYWRRHYGMTLA